MTRPTWAICCGRSSTSSSIDAQLLDLLLLCGWYHAISFTARAARVPLEDGAPTFDSVRLSR